MNALQDLDATLTAHLRNTAAAAEPRAQLDAIVAADRTARVVPIGRPRRSGRGRLFLAAAALTALGIGALAVLGNGDVRAPASSEVPPSDPGLPAPSFVAAIGNYVPSGMLRGTDEVRTE